MANLDSILRSRDITLPTKVRLVKAMVFPTVMYRCERRTVKKTELTYKKVARIIEKTLAYHLLRSICCYFANRGPSSQSYGFSSSHVWM